MNSKLSKKKGSTRFIVPNHFGIGNGVGGDTGRQSSKKELDA
jgi:hypothetical protein